MPLIDRFWSKIKKTDGCWIWTGSKNGLGYGRIEHHGIKYATHRFSYQMKYGPIPNGLWVLHHCDNPPCVNPKHLFTGTPRDNTQDMISKGRFVGNVGGINGHSKIREVLSNG